MSKHILVGTILGLIGGLLIAFLTSVLPLKLELSRTQTELENAEAANAQVEQYLIESIELNNFLITTSK